MPATTRSKTRAAATAETAQPKAHAAAPAKTAQRKAAPSAKTVHQIADVFDDDSASSSEFQMDSASSSGLSEPPPSPGSLDPETAGPSSGRCQEKAKVRAPRQVAPRSSAKATRSAPTLADIPSYITSRKDGKHKAAALRVFGNPKATLPIGSGCALCNSEQIHCVVGDRGKCARCAAGGISAANCRPPDGVGNGVGGATAPYVTRTGRPSKRPASTVESTAAPTGTAKRRKTQAGGLSHLKQAAVGRMVEDIVEDTARFHFNYSNEDVARAALAGANSEEAVAAGEVIGRTLLELRRAVLHSIADMQNVQSEQFGLIRSLHAVDDEMARLTAVVDGVEDPAPERGGGGEEETEDEGTNGEEEEE